MASEIASGLTRAILAALCNHARVMKRRRAKITALGRYVPPKVVTNYDLSKMVDTNHDWIVERTGIVERHWVEPGTPNSELAAYAASDRLKQRGIEASEIDLIIVAPDFFMG
jgi:3-oxoacyl-[acyl-carrier-protein] synthase III